MDSHITEMNAKLCLEVNDVRVVGIWGMGGLGKTTIAKAVYGEIACEFEHSCFVHDVKDMREAKVQEELLLSLLKVKRQDIDFQRGRDMMMKRLDKRKVLVVLDDVLNFSQIKELLGEPHAFGKGSRIIVTTRDQQSPKEVNETYHPECLNQKNSHELLVKHAFGTDPPSEEYTDLLNQAIEYAHGLPLALKVLGASLYDKNIHQWKDLLEKIKIIPERKIMDVLRISFKGLDVLEQQIFLDIACHFRGWDHLEVKEILHDFHSHIGLENLVNRALITISNDELDMHDLLQEMGREIVRREYLGGPLKEPRQYSRLWSFKDVDQVLTQNTATDAIECLMLDLADKYDEYAYDWYEEYDEYPYCINVGAFARMTNLRVLIIGHDRDNGPYEHESRGELEFLSDQLSLLQRLRCPLESLPNTFIPTNLVILDMSYSDIQRLWEGKMPLQNLKEIRLTRCHSLVKIPDLTEAIHLKKLYLNYCSSLLELHSSVSALQELEYLTLKRCEQLKILPSSLHMKSLVTLKLSGCSNLEKFPEISDVMSELQKLDLAETAIKELPESINNLTGLRVLNLSHCKELTTLSSSIHMKSLETLNLFECSNLEKFPEISDVMSEIQKLDLSCTKIKELPESINNLTGLRVLNLSHCKELTTLPSSIRLSLLRRLHLRGCSNLENFPEISGITKELSELCLDGTAVKGLPSSIHLLQGLKKLTMQNCKSLECLPDSICNLAQLTHLYLEGCNRLKSIPELSSIIHIDAHCRTALETVSTPKIDCTDLHFRFYNCRRLVQTNLFTNIVETRFLDQDFHPRPLSCYMCFPGSEIPSWFSHQSRASSISVQLPPHWFDKMFLGFAICAVSCFNETNPYHFPGVARCYCTFKGNQGEHNFSFQLQDWDFTSHKSIPSHKSLESDHMFMAYVSWSKFSLAEKSEPVNERYYTEATLRIVVESTCNSRSERHCMTRYGVRFFHGSYMDGQNESMTNTTIHVEGLEAPFFPDQLEIRKSVTEWEAESTETAIERGTYQILELFPEPQAERNEEVMVAAAQVNGPQVLGSVCCCLSLSRCSCIMSSSDRNRKRRRHSI